MNTPPDCKVAVLENGRRLVHYLQEGPYRFVMYVKEPTKLRRLHIPLNPLRLPG